MSKGKGNDWLPHLVSALTAARKVPGLRLEVSESSSTLKLIGELDMSNADRLREAFHAHQTPRGIVLDLSELTFMDSAGLQVILGRALALESGVIAIRDASPMVRKLFTMTGVDRVPGLVVETEDDGVRGAVRAPSDDPLEEESA